jgi:hypothetical protein
LGVRRALNQGFALARGEYLARQDADDRSAPGRLAAQVARLDAHPAVGLLGTLTQTIDAQGQPLAARVFDEALDDAALQRLLLQTCPFCHGSVMLRRSALDATGLYDESMAEAEDYDLWLRLAETTQVANLPDRLYDFRYYADSVTGRRHPKVMRYMAVALERAILRRHGSQPTPEQRAPLARAYARAALSAFAHHEVDAARALLAQALAWRPALLNDEAALADLLAPHTNPLPPGEAVAFLNAAFASLFPPAPQMAAVRARLVSHLHMREVFAGAAQNDWRRVQAHLRPGLRANPRWLFNRGVLSLLIKSGARRIE